MNSVVKQIEQDARDRAEKEVADLAELVVHTVCVYTDVSRKEIFASSHNRKARHARHLAAKVLRDLGYSFPSIARAISPTHTHPSAMNWLEGWGTISQDDFWPSRRCEVLAMLALSEPRIRTLVDFEAPSTRPASAGRKGAAMPTE